MMKNLPTCSEIVGTLFRDENSRLCLLDDNGTHALLTENTETGEILFLSSTTLTDVVTISWENQLDITEHWAADIYEGLCEDLEEEGTRHTVKEIGRENGALLLRS
jgi:hypothetical protein